jgi:p-aminobenzoyl-glutamate transporter AbgT
MEIAGLPLHPLVVHAAVVLIPLTALLTIGLAALPRWRWLLRWPTAAASLVCVGLAFLATTSGRSLEHARPGLARLVREHAARGQLLANLTVVLAVVVVAAAFVLPGPSALVSGRGERISRGSLADKVLPVLLVLAAVVVLVQVVRTGDSGARAVWG